MKTLFTILIAAGLLAFGSAANAATVNIAPGGGDIVCSETDLVFNTTITRCWDGAGTSDPSAFDAADVEGITGFSATDADGNPLSLSLLYKSNYDDGTGAGTYADNYGTAYAGDPNDALITSAVTSLVGDSDIFPVEDRLINDVATCSVCFLYVKDGSNDPIWYIFDISTWNGTDDLSLSGFWPENGAISHVAIFGLEGDKGLTPPEVPIPPAVWLFGSGLIGLVGVARRKA